MGRGATYVQAIARVILPIRCMLCGEHLAASGAFDVCAVCQAGFEFNDAPRCAACDRPETHHACLACPAGAHAFDQARAPLLYNDTMAMLLAAGRRPGRTDIWRQLSRCLADDAAASGLVRSAPYLVPVPSGRRRLLQRGFNPSARLARHLGAAWDKKVRYLLRPIRDTARQNQLSIAKRQQNMTAAYTCCRPISGHVVLVDDYIITGATARAAARALRAAGAHKVFVLALGRGQS